jgi:hypothetical protein
LGVKVTTDKIDGTIEHTPPHLIQSILDDFELTEKSNTQELPALSSKIMQKFENSLLHNEDWHYRSVIAISGEIK